MLENMVTFYLNDKLMEIRVKPSESIWDVLQRLNLYGTKKSCGEGDCGSCTIAISDFSKSDNYKAITSCITPATKMHKQHIITIEGLGKPEATHPIQQIIFDNHATQCGYCTPGIIMSLFSRLSEKNIVTQESLNKTLEGNLCRCTGYKHIIQANDEILEKVNNATITSKNILPDFCDNMSEKLNKISNKIEQFEIPNDEVTNIKSYNLIQNLDELKQKMNDTKNFKIVTGATDIFVEKNIHKKYYENYFDISRIDDLKGISIVDDKIEIGATESLENVMNNELVEKFIPSINLALFWMSSRQIRNIASLAGNIGNASPIGDASSVLVGLNASVELFSASGTRMVKLDQYFLDYKSTVLKKNEIIKKIVIPVQQNHRFYNFIKTTKRKNLDISTVNSFCNIEINSENIIKDIRLVYGGVSVYPKVVKKALTIIVDKKINDLDYEKIGNLLFEEFTPISDVRASDKYRNLLIRNHLIKHIEKLRSNHEIN